MGKKESNPGPPSGAKKPPPPPAPPRIEKAAIEEELSPEDAKKLTYIVGNIKACNRLIKYCEKSNRPTRNLDVLGLRGLACSLALEGKELLDL